jgi:hypothetical protein
MDDLPTPTPSEPQLSADDLRLFLTGVTPGWYRTADLYPRYLAWAERSGRAPVTVQRLGVAIRRNLRLDSAYTQGHVKVWNIDSKLLAP